MTIPGIRQLFAPRSIAVVGASTRETTFTYQMVRTMAAQLEGIDLVAVNPRATEVAGVPAVPSLDALSQPIDLAVVATPAATVVEVLDQAAEGGAQAAVILSSGFAEVGGDGTALQAELRARASTMAILGPNCQGMMYRLTGLVATFTPSIRDVELPPAAPIGYVGQSGALGGAFADAARERGVAMSAWVSTGNQVGVAVEDAATYLVDDGQLRELFVYLEQTPDGAAWVSLCERAEAAGCALTVLRSGTSSAGKAAVASHTGALVGDDRAFEAVSREHGVRFVDDIDSLVSRALLHLGRPAHRLRGQAAAERTGVVVLSSSGGAGAIAADQADRHGVELTTLRASTHAALAPLLPSFASTTNPIDVTAQLFTSGTAELGTACQVIAADAGVGHILVVLSLILDPGAAALAEDLVRAAADLDVPLSVVYLASRDRTAGARAILAAGGVAVYDSVGSAMRALAGGPGSPGPRPVSSADEAPSDGLTTVTLEHGGLALLDSIGVPHPTSCTVHTAAQAEAAVSQVGGVAVMKLGIEDVAHKSELDAVRVGVVASAAGRTYEELVEVAAQRGPDREARVVVYALAPDGIELIVNVQGAADGYPPTITVGWGGTLVELLDDVTTFTARARGAHVERELRRLRCWRLLAGWRGGPAADVPALISTLERLAEWATQESSGLVELEVNPLRVHPVGGGVSALDLHAVVDSTAGSMPPRS